MSLNNDRVRSEHSFIAGSLSGITGTFIGQPLDTTKVLMQTDPFKYQKTIQSMKKLVSDEGFMALYKGGLSQVTASLFTTALSFGFYSNAMRFISNFRKHDIPTSVDIFLAGGASAFVNSFILTPGDQVKTKLQTQAHHSVYRGNWDCFKTIFKHEGVRGLYRGITLKILCDVPGVGIYFLTYEQGKRILGTSQLAILNAGGLAGCIGWISIYPIDLMRSRIQALPVYPSPGYDRYTGMFDCAAKVYKENGIRSFYRGLGSCCLRAYPVNAIRFLTFSKVTQYLEELEI